jgi:hypothetical protein
MSITVRVKNVYGNDLVYPVDLKAHQFASLIGCKTFNRKQLVTIKALGYEVRVKAGQLPFTL